MDKNKNASIEGNFNTLLSVVLGSVLLLAIILITIKFMAGRRPPIKTLIDVKRQTSQKKETLPATVNTIPATQTYQKDTTTQKQF